MQISERFTGQTRSTDFQFLLVFFLPLLARVLRKESLRSYWHIYREETEARRLSIERSIDRMQRARIIGAKGEEYTVNVLGSLMESFTKSETNSSMPLSIIRQSLQNEMGIVMATKIYDRSISIALKTIEALKGDKPSVMRMLILNSKYFSRLMGNVPNIVHDSVGLILNTLEKRDQQFCDLCLSGLLKNLIDTKPVTLTRNERKECQGLSWPKPATGREFGIELSHFGLSGLGLQTALEFFAKGKRELDRKNYSRSIFQYSQCLRLLPQATCCLYNMALSYSGHQDYFMAIRYLERTLELNPKSTRAWFALALSHMLLKNRLSPEERIYHLEAAIHACGEYLKMHPEHADAYALIGDVYREKGEIEKSEKALISATKISPSNPYYWISLGLTWAAKTSLDDATMCFLRASQLDPTREDAWINLGSCAGELGEYSQAIRYFKRALEINPQISEVWYNLGAAYEALGQETNACECFSKAEAIAPYFLRKE